MTSTSPYVLQTCWSDPGNFAAQVAAWPADPVGLSRAIAALIVHVRSDEARGDPDSGRLGQDLPLRTARELLEAAAARNGASGSGKVGAVCRDFALLAAAAFRARGHPARLRVGFAEYFTAGFFEDHWLCEWHDGKRWRRLDVEVAAGAADTIRPLDPTDVPSARFATGAEAWRRTGQDPTTEDRYGVSALGLAGRWFVAGSVYRDAAALMKLELKPWDYWGACAKAGIDRAPLNAEIAAEVDRLSSALRQSSLDEPDSLPTGLAEWLPEGSVTSYPLGEAMTVDLNQYRA